MRWDVFAWAAIALLLFAAEALAPGALHEALDLVSGRFDVAHPRHVGARPGERIGGKQLAKQGVVDLGEKAGEVHGGRGRNKTRNSRRSRAGMGDCGCREAPAAAQPRASRPLSSE